MNAELTPAQLEEFAAQGYLVLPARFHEEEVARMRAEADHILELIVNSSLAHGRQSRRLDMRALSDGSLMVRKIQPINDLSLYLTRIADDERLLAPMRQIMQDEPVLMEEKLNYKQPLAASIPGIAAKAMDDRFPVHSDWAYYRAQNYPQDILSSAITMDACRADSGPIRVWPGTHKQHLAHEAMDNGLQVKPDLVDFAGGIDVLAPAGSVLLFHALLIHNSVGNTSGRPRRLMIYSHFPAAAGIAHDIRNGPTRLREAPWEWLYLRRKVQGAYTDTFAAPRTAG